MMMRAALALAAALLPALAAGSAQAADYAMRERMVVESVGLPLCFDPKVFNEISEAFGDKERQYWASNLALIAFGDVHEIAYRPWGVSFIPRRFCEAQTRVSDGTQRTVFYSIGHNTGTLGVKWGVEFCVEGLDRNLAYAPNCRMAQP